MNLLGLFYKSKGPRGSLHENEGPESPMPAEGLHTVPLNDSFVESHRPRPVECAFSMDDPGQMLHGLWEQYTSAEPANAHTRFCEFADQFLQLYEPVVHSQCARPLSTVEEQVVAQPLRLQETSGHPSEVVIHVARSLLSFLEIQADVAGIGTLADSAVRLSAGDVSVNVQAFFNSSEESSVEDQLMQWQLRQQFVRTLRCLSVLVFWKHNRRVLRRHLGPEFINIIVELLGVLVAKIEELGVLWAENDLPQPRSAALQEDTSFVSSAILGLVHFITRSVNSFQIFRQGPGLGTLSNQPWGLAECVALGFDVYDVPMFSRILNTIHSSRASEPTTDICSIMLKMRRKYLTDVLKPQSGNFSTAVADALAQLRAMNDSSPNPTDQSPVTSASQLLQAVEEYRKTMTAENWAGLFLRSGAMKALLSFLRKSVPLMRSIESQYGGRTVIYQRTEPCNEKFASYAHRSCSILQNEALYALQTLMLSEAGAARAYFHMCDGPSITAYILSCRSYGLDSIVEPTEQLAICAQTSISLQFSRSLMCLRIAEICLLMPGEDEEIRQAAKDCQMIFEQLGGLLEWMMRYMTIPALVNGASMVVECEYPSECEGPSPTVRELWPWDTEIPQPPFPNFLTANEPSPLNYHLCKHGMEAGNLSDLDGEVRTTSREQRFSDALNTPLRAIAVGKSSILEHISRAGYAWFAAGHAGRAWTTLFDIIFSACNAHRGAVREARRTGGQSSHTGRHYWDLLRQVLFSVGNFFLRMENPEGELHSRGSDHNHTPMDPQLIASLPSYLQYHILIFLARCLRTAPTETIWVCRQMRVWDLLLSKHFILGGQASVDRIREASLQRMRPSPSCSQFFNDDSVDPTPQASSTTTTPSNNEPTEEDAPPTHCFGMKPGGSIRKLRWQPATPTTEDLIAFSWMATRDGILDLLMMVIEATLVPPTSHFVQGPQHELRHAIDLLSESSPDTVVYQVCSWLAILVNDRRRAEAFSPLLKRHAMSNAMMVCRAQLHDLGLTSFNLVSSVTQNLVLVEKSRPFLWPARVAVLSLVLLLLQDEGEGCLELFLTPVAQRRVFENDELQRMFSAAEESQPNPERSDGSFSSATRPQLHSVGGTVDFEIPDRPPEQSGAEHPTLFFLYLDPRCRHAALYILTELLHLCAFRQLQELQPHNEQTFTLRSGRANAAVARPIKRASSAPPSNIGVPHSSHPSNVSMIALAIVSGLLDHLSISMKLPSWCKGFHGAMCILRWISSMLLDPEKRFLIRYHQSLLRKSRLIVELQAFITTATLKYRRVVRTHIPRSTSKLSLNLQDHMDSEQTAPKLDSKRAADGAPDMSTADFEEPEDDSSTNTCATDKEAPVAKESKTKDSYIPVWPKEDKRVLVRQVLATFAALMLDNDANKSEFKDLMQSRKKSKSRLTGRGGTVKAAYAPYHDLKRVIIHVDPTPSLEMFLVLLNMVVDADHFNPHYLLSRPLQVDTPLFIDQFETPKVHSTEIVPLIFYLMPHAPVELQRNLLFTFEQLARAHSNHSVFTFMQPSLVDLVLDLIPSSGEGTLETVMRLLKIIGTHSISVAQLKRIFRVMHSKGDYRPHYSWRLLDALRGMVMNEEHEEGPRACFLFEGIKSGLKLPVMPRWPAAKGYTFYTWLRIERQSKRHTSSPVRARGVDFDDAPRPYAGPTEEGRYMQSRPYLLTLRNEIGMGVDIYLRSKSRDEFVLVIESHKGERQPPASVELTSSVLKPGFWYFIAVSHNSGTFRNKPEVTLVVNDKFYADVLPYPKFPGPVQRGFVGECVGELMETKYLTAFSGQMGAIYFFDEALSVQQLQGVYRLGPGYTYSFESPTIDRRDVLYNLSAENRSVVAPALDGFLTQHIMLAYNPSVYEGDSFLDNTPEKNAIRWKSGGLLSGDSDESASNVAGHMHAKRLAGTFEYIFRDVRDALDCLGGVKVLFPLFAQFDQPVQLYDGTIEYRVDQQLNVKVLDLLNALLRESSENERILRKYGGFAIVGYFLERVSPLHMSQDALDSICELIDRVSWNASFQDSAVVHLLANFKLWVFTPVEVQHAVFDALRRLCMDRDYGAQRMRSTLSIQSLFDILNMFYWYEAPKLEDSAAASHDDSFEAPRTPTKKRGRPVSDSSARKLAPVYTASRWVHPVTGELIGQKPKGRDLIELRARVFDIILTLMTEPPGVQPEDVQALMGFLVHAPDALSKVEAMQVLLRLFRDPTHSGRALASLSICNGAHIILGFCSHIWAKVRLYALVTFCRIVYRASTLPAMPTFPVELFHSAHGGVHMVTTPVSFDAAGLDTPKELSPPSPVVTESARGRKSLTMTSLPSTSSFEHTKNPTFREALMAIEGMEVWNALGLHPTRLHAILMATQAQVTEAIKADFLTKDTLDAQLQLVVEALQRLMIGEPADHLIDQIENLCSDGKGEPSAGDFLSEENTSSVHVLEQLQSPVPGEEIEVNEFGISNAYICTPAVFPVLMRFLAADMINSALRLKVLVNIKAYFVNPHNCDVILALDCWQDSVLYMLSSCHRRLAEMKSSLSTTDDEALKKRSVKEQSTIDTALRMLCDLQLHAVRYGAPKTSAKTFSADESRGLSSLMYEDRLSYLVQIKDNRRKVGVTVLRETMSYVRYYGEEGELPVFKTGLDLLQQTIDILQREHESQYKGKYKSLSEITAQERSLQLNIWLVAAVILEFLAVPPLQKQLATGKQRRPSSHATLPTGRIRSRRAQSVESEDLDIVSEESGTRPSQISFDGEVQVAEVTTLDPSTPVEEDTNVSNVVIEQYFADEPKHQQSRALRRSHSVGDKLPTLPVAQAFHVYSIPEDEPTGSDSTPPIGVLDIGPNVEPSVSHVAFPDDLYKPVWHLLDSLIGLLGPLENAPAWLSARGTSLLARAGLSPKAQSRKQEPTFADVMTTTERGPPMRANSSRSLTMTPRTKTTLSAVTGNVPWIMVRCLVSVFTQGGLFSETEMDEVNAAGHPVASIPLQALQRMTVLLTALHDNEFEHYDFEVLYVLAVVIRTLATTQLPPSSSWVQGALQFIIRLLRNHADEVRELVETYRAAKVPPSEETNKITNTTLLASLMDKIFSKRKNDSGLSDERATDLSILERVSFSENCDAASLALQAIQLSLGDEFANLTWEEWFAAVRPVLDEAKRLEHAILSVKLTELGSHRHAQETGIQLQSRRARIFRLGEKMQALIASITTDFHRSESVRIWEMVNHSEALTQRCALKWGRILSELANERGAWGYGANDETQIFWMLDGVEDNTRRRLRLVRNQFGSRHATASMLTRGDVPVAPTSDGPENGSLIRFDGETADHTAHDLWKDLTKYQRKAQTKLAEENERDGDNLEETKETKDTHRLPDRRDDETTKLLEPTASALQLGEATKRRVLFSADCEVIMPFVSTPGQLELTKQYLYFFQREGEAPHQPEAGEEWTWVLQPASTVSIATSDIKDCACRYYQLRFVAVELFLTNRTTMFINLHTQKDMKAFVAMLKGQLRPQYVTTTFGRSPKTVAKFSGAALTQLWTQREISNLEYLMALNTIAGRTFNDLAQYPVLPWVLSNYESRRLDLRDPRNYRDLRYPMGAQKEKQRRMFADKYAQLEQQYREAQEMTDDPFGAVQDQWPPFHYGTHYSTAGFVLWYLLRLEPYTALHIHLQDGRFDKPDRLFDSIAATYAGCTTNASDVKELVPEMYFLPECLTNTNNCDLGTTQSGNQLGDVVLPPWAKDAADFIHIHREALESEFVSRNLHHWIDLIFGYKQRPPVPPSLGGDPACVEACNVFFYLTYEGAVDLEKLRANEGDRALYETTIKQIDNFGQTPIQLFDRPHPQRLPIDQADIIWPIASIVQGVHTIPKGEPQPEKPNRIMSFAPSRVSYCPILLIAEVSNAERLVTVDAARVFGYHYWQVLSPDVVPPFKLRVDNVALELSQGPNAETSYLRLPSYGGGANTRDRRVGVPFAPQGLTSKIQGPAVDLHPAKSQDEYDAEPPLQRASSARPKRVSRVPSHVSTMKASSSGRDSATSTRSPHDMYSSRLLAVHEEWRLLFSCGHWDQSFKVTSLETGKLLQSVAHHRDVVTCLALAHDMGRHWLVTASRDCTVVVWEIFPDKETPVPSTPLHVLYGHDDSVNCVAVLADLDLVASGSDDGTIILHTLREGQYIQSITSRSRALPVEVSSTSPAKDTTTGAPHEEVTSFARSRLHWVGLSKMGYLCSYSQDDTTLCTYTLNGRFLTRKDVNEQLYSFTFSEDGAVLLTGGVRGEVVFRWVRNLELAEDAQRKGFAAVLDGSMPPMEGSNEPSMPAFGAPIRALRLTRGEKHLLVGLQTGMLHILAQDSDYLRQRLQKKLVEIGIL